MEDKPHRVVVRELNAHKTIISSLAWAVSVVLGLLYCKIACDSYIEEKDNLVQHLSHYTIGILSSAQGEAIIIYYNIGKCSRCLPDCDRLKSCIMIAQ